jgi:hypothetical protein
LVFSMSGANQLRSVFEECVLAHQPFDGGSVLQIRILSELSLFCVAQFFLRFRMRPIGCQR